MVSWTKSQLPTPTNDLDKVANDIDQWGYGLLEDALSEPLLTKTEYLQPSHLDQSSSNSLTFGPAVSLGSFVFKRLITPSKSSERILFSING